jgi:hypothetical protein
LSVYLDSPFEDSSLSLLFQYGHRHWPALLVLGLMIWRIGREGFRENIVLGICIGLAALGIAMNLVVILINGKMPAALSQEEIGEEDGDVLLLIAAGVLVLRFLLGVLG